MSLENRSLAGDLFSCGVVIILPPLDKLFLLLEGFPSFDLGSSRRNQPHHKALAKPHDVCLLKRNECPIKNQGKPINLLLVDWLYRLASWLQNCSFHYY